MEPQGTIITSEQRADGTPVKVRYRMGGFGLKFVEYIND